MKKKMKKSKKKNRRLLFQIGSVTAIYSLLLVLIFSWVIYFVGLYGYLQAKEDQVTENLRRLNEKFFGANKIGANLSDQLLDYMKEHPEMLKKALTGEYTEEETAREEEYYDAYSEWINNGGSQKEFYQGLDDELMKYAVDELYFSLAYNMLEEHDSYGHRDIALIDMADIEHPVVIFEADNRLAYTMDDYFRNPEDYVDQYEKTYGFVCEWDPVSEHEQLQEMIMEQSTEPVIEVDWKSDGEECINGFYPVFIDGKIRCILMISSEWAVFQDTMLESAGALSKLGVFIIAVSEALLLIFVYFKAVRPLRKVKNSVNRYIGNKDSEAVVHEMENIKQRNEFGLLADDIASMVREIDRYTNENMELAGEREKASIELELAAKIQNGMLRRDFPKTPEYEIYAMMDPAKEVGGDFYDFFEVDATHIALVIADVAGKGVPGSLFMMSALSVIRAKTLAGVMPAEILTDVNQELIKSDVGDMFVTVWLGILDLESGILTAANAGHEYPVLKTDGKFELLRDKHGFVVGGMEGVTYQNYEIDLSKGGTLFVYTDGVPEATADNDELYGTERMLEALNLYPEATPKELAQHVKLDVDLFVGEAEQFDDLTILCLTYTPSIFRE